MMLPNLMKFRIKVCPIKLAGEVVEEIQQVANEGQETILKINGRSRIITQDPLNVKNGFINLFFECYQIFAGEQKCRN